MYWTLRRGISVAGDYKNWAVRQKGFWRLPAREGKQKDYEKKY